jgi:hypothetical protein
MPPRQSDCAVAVVCGLCGLSTCRLVAPYSAVAEKASMNCGRLLLAYQCSWLEIAASVNFVPHVPVDVCCSHLIATVSESLCIYWYPNICNVMIATWSHCKRAF